jgi:Na+/melibiose symporter-like transporter
LSVVSLPALPPAFGLAMTLAGLAMAALYVRHARRSKRPVLELRLLRIPTLRAAVIGGAIFRLGAGAVPFLFPLMLQLGFGYTPLQSGLVSAVSIGGAMMMKALVKPILKRFGFRVTLVGAALVGGVLMGAIGFYRPETPVAVLVVLLLIGGFFRSLFFTGVNTLAFADVAKTQTGDATSMLAAFQQIAIAGGVAMAGGILEVGITLNGTGQASLADFSVAFFVVGFVTILAALSFWRLPDEAGAEVAGRRAPAE